MDLVKLAKEKKVLLAAHRGICGGNIPCNSIPAFKAALNQGADIIELDVENTSDGQLFIQHPGLENLHLRMNDSITLYPASTVEQFVQSNSDLTRTEYHIPRLEEVFALLKGKCVINVDKFWKNPEKIANLIRKYDMKDQILIKTPNREDCLDAVEEYAPDIPYMSIAKEEDTTYIDMSKRKINHVGTEAIFKTEDSKVCSKEYIDMVHSDGKIVWVNALVYDYQKVLSAYHNDDISAMGDEENGWGWLADRGFDIIQTDFLCHCKHFLEDTGRRNK